MFRLRYQDVVAIVLAGLVAVGYVILALSVQDIDFPGGTVLIRVAFYAAGLLAMLAAFPILLRGAGTYAQGLLLLLVLLAVGPLMGGFLFRPDHADLVPQYLMAAFGNAAYAAFGILFLRQGLGLRAMLGIWGAMALATMPALLEMFAVGFGVETRIAAAGLHITEGDHFLIATLLLIAVLSQLRDRMIVYVAGFIFLSAIGSRTSLYSYFLALPIILLMTPEPKGVVPMRMLGVIALVAAIPLGLSIVTDQLAGTRMFSFFADATADTSVQGRISTLEGGWQDILDSPVVGAFGSHIDRYGEDGWYIHNYLELWRQFGLAPFLLFLVLLAGAIPFGLFRSRSIHPNVPFTFLLISGPLFAQILLSRSYGYPQIFMVLGMAAALRAHDTFRAAGYSLDKLGGGGLERQPGGRDGSERPTRVPNMSDGAKP